MVQELHVDIQLEVTCPHCWRRFPSQDVLWVAAHHELVDDPRLGPDAKQRFLPSRFSVDGLALDTHGLTCQELACPHCHLRIPRAVVELRPFFVSIAGAPACGKSFLLAAMAWQLRHTLPRSFQLNFGDTDPESNRILTDYEGQLFVNPKPGELVKLAKTQEAGDWYNQVTYDEQTVVYPQPFLFEIRPTAQHPAKEPNRVSRLIALYDNAGESFQPGKDTVTSAVTRHLAAADAWLFCYDPTQNPRFREDCKGRSSDPQVTQPTVTSRQESLFHEMVSRIKKHESKLGRKRHSRPLIILCTKYDAWQEMLDGLQLTPPWRTSARHSIDVLDLEELSRVRTVVWTTDSL